MSKYVLFLVLGYVIQDGFSIDQKCFTQSIQRQTTHCIPTSRHLSDDNVTCMAPFSGNGINWFDAQKSCEDGGGRLMHLREDFTDHSLIATIHGGHHVTTQVRLGLLSTENWGSKTETFWYGQGSVDLCSKGTTGICGTNVTKSACAALGCCFTDSTCKNPATQSVSRYNTSVVTSSATAGPSVRSCVQMERFNSTWTWTTYDCSDPGTNDTLYVCEFRCGSTWPHEELSNITWSLHRLNPTSQTPYNAISSSTTKPLTSALEPFPTIATSGSAVQQISTIPKASCSLMDILTNLVGKQDGWTFEEFEYARLVRGKVEKI